MPLNTDVEIRALRAGDAPEWRALWAAYLAFYETDLAADVYDTTFARLVAPDEAAMQGLIALADGVPVGLAHVVRHRHCWRPEDILYLQDLYVEPHARGRGIGAALIAQVYAMGDASGVPGVYWTTQHFNTTARALYDRIGALTPFIKYQRP